MAFTRDTGEQVRVTELRLSSQCDNFQIRNYTFYLQLGGNAFLRRLREPALDFHDKLSLFDSYFAKLRV